MYICEYGSDAIKHVDCNEDLKKLLKSPLKDIVTKSTGKHWLRYSSFSAISRVKWKRDQIIEKVLQVKFSHFCVDFL